MPTESWKNDERAICEIFHSIRSGPVGKHGPDCLPERSHPYNVQVKRRKVVPAWLQKAMAQAQHDTRRSDRIATVVIHPHNVNIRKSMVVFELGDFERMFLE